MPRREGEDKKSNSPTRETDPTMGSTWGDRDTRGRWARARAVSGSSGKLAAGIARDQAERTAGIARDQAERSEANAGVMPAQRYFLSTPSSHRRLKPEVP